MAEDIILLEYHEPTGGQPGQFHNNYWDERKRCFLNKVDTWGWKPVGILKRGVNGTPAFNAELDRLRDEGADFMEVYTSLYRFIIK